MEEWVRELQPIVERGGRPFNYHPTEDEVAAQKSAESASEAEKAAAEQAAAAEEREREAVEKQARDAEASKRRAALAHDEAELLEARSAPLRKWLADNVLPALSEGLLEIAAVQPDDPVNYLADFLFRKAATASAHQ